MLTFLQQLQFLIILTQLWHFISIVFICGIVVGLAVVLFVILSRRQRFKSKRNVSKPAHNYDTNLKIILNAFSQLSIIITFDALVLVLNYMDRSSIVYRGLEWVTKIESFCQVLRSILFDYSCCFSRLFLPDVSVNQICEVTKF